MGVLKGNVTGPLLELLLNDKFLKVIEVLGKLDPDPNQLNAVANIRARARKAKGSAGKVVEA